jgi:hypothetical protein
LEFKEALKLSKTILGPGRTAVTRRGGVVWCGVKIGDVGNARKRIYFQNSNPEYCYAGLDQFPLAVLIK